MKSYRISRIEVPRYPVLAITYEDGLSGEKNFSEEIATYPVYASLKDPDYFRTVGIKEGGYAFGWNLEDIGNELDFCADSTRYDIETQIVRERAAEYRRHRAAAE